MHWLTMRTDDNEIIDVKDFKTLETPSVNSRLGI
jgi:hypothetical protein